jgi:hypothetical protein
MSCKHSNTFSALLHANGCWCVLLQDYYELGVILTRKRLFTQATKNLEKAKKLWDGEESDLAQVRVLLVVYKQAAAC